MNERTEQLVRRIVAIVDDRQGTDVVALDVGGLLGYTDVLIVCTARNERLAKAIAEEVHERLKREDGLLPSRVEGLPEARWVLVDYLDCILHVFVPETRDLYRLDRLWGEAPKLDISIDEHSATSQAAGNG